MNKRQRTIIVFGCLLVLFLVLFPPWKQLIKSKTDDPGVRISLGRHFLFSGNREFAVVSDTVPIVDLKSDIVSIVIVVFVFVSLSYLYRGGDKFSLK